MGRPGLCFLGPSACLPRRWRGEAVNAAKSRPQAGLAAVVQTRMAEQEEGKGPREKWLISITVPKGRVTVGLGHQASSLLS